MSGHQAEAETTCVQCGEPIVGEWPVLIVGRPYHHACAVLVEEQRAGIADQATRQADMADGQAASDRGAGPEGSAR